MRELGAIVRTGSCFCCTQNAGFPGIPRPQHDNVFCRGISPLFNWSACRQLWFLHNGDRCRPFLWLFWWSSDKWASGPGLKALKCGGDLSVRNGGCTRGWDSSAPYEATEYGDHRSPQADWISHDLSNYTVYLTVVGFLARSTIPKSSTPKCVRTKSNGS